MIKINPNVHNPWADIMATTEPQNLWEHANKLTLIALRQKLTEAFLKIFGREYRVSPDLLDEIRCNLKEGYFGYYAQTDEAVFDSFWKDFVKLLEHNRALCEFMFIGDAAHSRTYPGWVLTIMRDGLYAKGMMVAVGEGLDWGGRPQKILRDDSFARGVAWGWTLGEAVHRQMIARSLLMESRRAVILGAGWLPELSESYGGNLPADLHIDACDIDPTIPLSRLMKQYPGLKYVRSSALDFLRGCPSDYYDVVIMPGVMTYNMADFEEFLDEAIRVLQPGKPFFFDMQVLHPELITVKLMYHWAEDVPNHGMKLMSSKKTIKYVKAACRKRGLKFEYSSSGHYKTSSALSFSISN